MARSPAGNYAERNRFGRVGRIATPTPFPVGDINVYLIFPPPGADGITLIDTGVKSDEAFEALRRGFKGFGVALEQVERILVTHGHMDHYGQARRIAEISGARVFASAPEAELMRVSFSPSASRSPRMRAAFLRWGIPEEVLDGPHPMRDLAPRIHDPIDVDGVLHDGERIAVGDLTLEAIETPGHCDGHLVFYERELRLLFAGDHLLPDITPVPVLVFPADENQPRPKSLLRFMKSLEKVESLECDLVFPAHGDVFSDHRALIESYRLHHERRVLQFERELRQRPATPFELGRKLFPKYWDKELFLVMSEVMGHLDVLIESGRAVLEERDGVCEARLVRESA